MSRRSAVENELRLTQQQLLESNQQLERQAMHDALTGLANRRCFDEALTQEIRMAHRDGTTLALLMIDIDHFKRYNDTYGHPAGDACLQQMAHLLSSCIRRPRDLLARYGGEEMAVILPDTDNDGATVVARLMLERLALQHIPHEGSPFGQVTASIGIACSDGAALDIAPSLIERADQALYIAKQAGRNRLHIDGANV